METYASEMLTVPPALLLLHVRKQLPGKLLDLVHLAVKVIEKSLSLMSRSLLKSAQHYRPILKAIGLILCHPLLFVSLAEVAIKPGKLCVVLVGKSAKLFPVACLICLSRLETELVFYLKSIAKLCGGFSPAALKIIALKLLISSSCKYLCSNFSSMCLYDCGTYRQAYSCITFLTVRRFYTTMIHAI